MVFQRLQQELKIRRYSVQTAKAYLHYNDDFLKFCNKAISEVSKEDVRSYLERLADKRCSGSTMRLAYNALKFYYSDVLHTNMMSEIRIPKKDQKITIGLTMEEVKRLVSAIKNPKHRLLVELIYSSGLRAGEAVKLKFKDILVEEKLLVIRSGKGRKDRKTILSEQFIKMFKDGEGYLFPGRKGHLTIRSVQQIIKTAAKKAKIRKEVYPHLLRHAFATHLMQNKVDSRYVQKLLGHKDQKTTEGYTYVDEQDLRKIKSPHDSL